MSFELCYHWLDSGHVLGAHFSMRDQIPADLRWLLMHEMADVKLVDTLQSVAFDCVKVIINKEKSHVRSSLLISALFRSIIT